MDFYLSDEKGKRLHFPMNPERITATTTARIQTFEAIELGEFALPRGTMLLRITFDGLLLGESRKLTSLVKSWRDPRAIAGDLSAWRNTGEKLRLLVTETPFNHDVFIQTFEHTWSGGHGDMRYSLELVQARDVFIQAEGQAKSKAEVKVLSASRSLPASAKTHTVVSGDTLWGIAKKHLHNGARYSEIYNLNKALIGPDPNKIKLGQVLRLPS
ncbi:LysM domain/BON superfamily protein [compost metagenome]